MQISSAMLWGRSVLKDVCFGCEDIETRQLLEHITGLDSAALLSRPKQTLSVEQEQNFRDMLRRRQEREPLAYIIGERGFMSLSFRVTPDVLIPRPETEFLVEYVVEAFAGVPIVGMDLATGSGCIAVSILKYLPQAQFLASDISFAALSVAASNADRYEVRDRILFVQGDLLRPFRACGGIDVIVSNPPYIPESDYAGLMPEVKREPKVALVAGDGLEFYRRIFAEAGTYLKPKGKILVELGWGQAEAVKALVPPRMRIENLVRDYSGIDRILVVSG